MSSNATTAVRHASPTTPFAIGIARSPGLGACAVARRETSRTLFRCAAETLAIHRGPTPSTRRPARRDRRPPYLGPDPATPSAYAARRCRSASLRATIRFVVIRHDPSAAPSSHSVISFSVERPRSPRPRSFPNIPPIDRPCIPAQRVTPWIAPLARSMRPLASGECLADARSLQLPHRPRLVGDAVAPNPDRPMKRDQIGFLTDDYEGK
jgi:hypothetical protein